MRTDTTRLAGATRLVLSEDVEELADALQQIIRLAEMAGPNDSTLFRDIAGVARSALWLSEKNESSGSETA